jgi:hypothetical protein
VELIETFSSVEETLCYFLPPAEPRESMSLQEVDSNFPLRGGPSPVTQDSSMSLKELEIDVPLRGESSNLALEDVLTHTQNLQYLTLRISSEKSYGGPRQHVGDVDAALYGLKITTLVCKSLL